MMRRVSLETANHVRIRRSPIVLLNRYCSFFRASVAKRLGDTKLAAAKGWSTKQFEESASREAHQKFVAKVEPLVRERLQKEFPSEFQSSWFSDTSAFGERKPVTLDSFKILLALNGFENVVKPSGNKSRLYLAEGVVATPPMQLSFNAKAIPFASGYQEFTRGMDIEHVGVFGDVHNHLVTATQSNKNTDRLFAQPFERSHLHPDDGKLNKDSPISSSLFPEFVQEDITLYRMAENSAARFLDSTYSSWTSWTQRHFVRPLKDARYRTRVAIKSVNAMRARLREFLEKSIAERAGEELSKRLSNIHERYERHHNNQSIDDTTHRVVEASSSSSENNDKGNKSDSDKLEKSPTVSEKVKKETSQKYTSSDNNNENNNAGVGEEKDEDPLETLVVISSRPTKSGNEGDEIVDSIALYRRMTPSTRILALPEYYVLRHSSASTLLSVSLVVFGALPLAYRSYVFSIDYDWLMGSGTIATSVIATISYGIFSWRWRARTSQSKTVHEALGARVGARDEAALLLLKEGAIRSVMGEILKAKDHRPQQNSKETPKKSSSSISRTSGAVVDPFEWANDFGLMDEPKDVAKGIGESKE